MRIAIVAEHYPPTSGGVATSSQRVARELVKLGADVQLFCFDNSKPVTSDDYVIEELDQGVRIARIGPFFLKRSDLGDSSLPEKVKSMFRRRALSQMARIAEQEKSQVVLSFYLLQAGFLAQFLARQLGLPCIAGVRGNDIGLNIFHVERFGVIQWVVNSADWIVCVNEHLRRQLLLAFPEVGSKSSVIENGVHVSDAAPSKSQARSNLLRAAGWGDQDLVVAFIGTLREKKGIVTLLKAVEHQPPHSVVRLLVIGPEIGNVETRLCGDLWALLKREGRLHVTGWVNRTEVASWAAGADVVVMPSLDDGMANGLLEGMALGLCPVVSDIFREVVQHGQSGMVVKGGDILALSRSFSLLAGDRRSVESMGARAYRDVKAQRDPRNEALAYLDLLQRIVTERS
jgi:glycosyltransferase involved in cell wall biosynthesis